MIVMEISNVIYSLRERGDEQSAAEVERLVSALAGLREDAARLDYLDALVKHPKWRCDVMLQYDHEDGVWLSDAERGTSLQTTPLDDGVTKTPDIRGAIDAAMKARAALTAKGASE